MSTLDFEQHRPRLRAIAYRMLGSVVDAEDIVQDAYLRWQRSDTAVESAGAWLTTIVSRLCLDRLQSARARREVYVGPWLPEPIVTRFLIGVAKKTPVDLRAELAEVNGWPCLVFYTGDQIHSVIGIETDGTTIHAVYAISDREKVAVLVGQLARPG